MPESRPLSSYPTAVSGSPRPAGTLSDILSLHAIFLVDVLCLAAPHHYAHGVPRPPTLIHSSSHSRAPAPHDAAHIHSPSPPTTHASRPPVWKTLQYLALRSAPIVARRAAWRPIFQGKPWFGAAHPLILAAHTAPRHRTPSRTLTPAN
ncbi:hypothetical protein FB451DRAFT_1391977 [Mycena latifolia]|nr:hypothetical protein FB451DRAFT_1391977 [Mycena latifolia]